MANYNPRAPLILGEEWVDIRDELLAFSPAINSFEQGHSFTLAAARTLTQGRFYVANPPEGNVWGQMLAMAVYPEGKAEQSGPISSVIIPVSAAVVSGTATPGVGVTAAEALLNPSDAKQLTFTVAAASFSTGTAKVFFATNSYAQLLNGKRILGVNVLYTANIVVTPETADPRPVYMRLMRPGSTSPLSFGPMVFQETSFVTTAQSPIERMRLGEMNHYWTTTSDPAGLSPIPERMPWNYAGLQQFEAGNADPICIQLEFLGISYTATVGYMALEVIFCEEQRVAIGGSWYLAGSTGGNFIGSLQPGTNILTMRTNQGYALNPVLAIGNYDLTLYSPDPGDLWFANTEVTAYSDQNALRELYQIPSIPGLRINYPIPLFDHLGEEFVQETTHILPQLSLHDASGTLTEPHVYGRQGDAQVWGTTTATQEIFDDVVGTNTVYQQVRYYARRFGDTTVPLKLTGSAGSNPNSTVSITPQDFDELAEIIDGWREVTLRFATAPTMGTGATPEPSWTWSAAGEKPGNRWEILAACAPALTGVPGRPLLAVSSPNLLYEATYGGSQAELVWMPQGIGSPYVSGMSADDNCDAVLIFSVDPNTVTGVSISQLSQTVSGIGLDCGSLPCCIPSGIGYQRVTWGLPPNTGVASDSFTRTVAAGSWGDADVGGTYTLTGTAADWSVNGTQGVLVNSTTAADRFAVLTAGIDFDVTIDAAITTVPTTAGRAGAVGRYTDAANQYIGRYEVDSAGAVTLAILKRVANVQTSLIAAASNVLAGGSGAFLTIRFMGAGTLLKLKVWKTGEPEPPSWDLETTDASLTTGSLAGIYVRDAGTVNSYLFDNLTISPPAFWFGAYELQRFDYLDPTGDFQTIMLATDVSLTRFNDYEARVGIPSVYRIRSLNALNFAGAWSTYVTGTLTSPGVSGGACGDLTGVLIFTSNADQTGADNAAYIMQWERDPTEEFALPEAGMVEYQPMYGRDGAVAFHGTERGLETFSRTVLLQAAAISPVALADASTIRDLAWANLPYVCVRDELGDRWFANVRVPSVAVRHNRTKYMARIDIVETTVTPYPVSP